MTTTQRLRPLFGRASAIAAAALCTLSAIGCADRSASPDRVGSDRSPALQVRTTAGTVEGVAARRPGVLAFLGVPYAAPPLGDLRWAPPRPAVAWEGVRPASRFGDRCLQTTPFPDMVFQSAAESEDCLTLSLWTRASGDAEAALPVMVWIHGGGFFSGASDEQRHDGSALADRGVVLVAINYRLGVPGFLAHPELSAESDHGASGNGASGNGASGNYGLLDQIAALEWVRDNVAAFGGDPGNVTIFGESAGSFSVSALMASPLADGLFHRAIGQSGSFLGGGTLALRPLAEAERAGSELAAAVGAASLAELRAMPAGELIAAAVERGTRFGPIVDGLALPEAPAAVFARGEQHDVPLMAGWTSAELEPPTPPADVFSARLDELFPGRSQEARELYPAGDDEERRRSATALASDSFIAYGTWKWIEVHAATGRSPVYRYLFDQVAPTESGPPPADDLGAAHASDIEYTFDTLDSRALAWRDEDRRVAELLTGYWASFAADGDPNREGLPEWPAWDETRRVMVLRAEAAAEPERHRARYELFERAAADR